MKKPPLDPEDFVFLSVFQLHGRTVSVESGFVHAPFFNGIDKFDVGRIDAAFPPEPNIKICIKRVFVHVQVVQVHQVNTRFNLLWLGMQAHRKNQKESKQKYQVAHGGTIYRSLSFSMAYLLPDRMRRQIEQIPFCLPKIDFFHKNNIQ
jgi:hypothetical protein